jgi:hypothetical protein
MLGVRIPRAVRPIDRGGAKLKQTIESNLWARHAKGNNQIPQFSYEKLPDCDPFAEEYTVHEDTTNRDIGTIRRMGANFEVRRPQDATYHSPVGSWNEAANWLNEHFRDPARFHDEELNDDD